MAAHAKPGVGRKQLIALYQSAEPQAKQGTVVSGASQVWRFVNDIRDGDWIVTYSPANRLYSIGKVTGLADIGSQALERIKDRVNELDWDDMQQLVAGILRAMGYKTQISPPGVDRGKDIVASPDGFGFEHPRIVVEVTSG